MQSRRKTLASCIIAGALAAGGYGFFFSSAAPTAQADLQQHPRLHAAVDGLRDAEDYLEHQPHDFHGHKQEAIHAIHEALREIRICVDIAERKSADSDSDAGIVPLDRERSHERLHKAIDRLREANEYLRVSTYDFHGHKGDAMRWIDEALRHLRKCVED